MELNYTFSKRDSNNRSTLIINGTKVGRVHFRENDAWLYPYAECRFKNQDELDKLGITVVNDPNNDSYPVKVYIDACEEEKIARVLSKAIRFL